MRGTKEAKEFCLLHEALSTRGRVDCSVGGMAGAEGAQEAVPVLLEALYSPAVWRLRLKKNGANPWRRNGAILPPIAVSPKVFLRWNPYFRREEAKWKLLLVDGWAPWEPSGSC